MNLSELKEIIDEAILELGEDAEVAIETKYKKFLVEGSHTYDNGTEKRLILFRGKKIFHRWFQTHMD